MKKVLRVDNKGFFIEDVILKDEEEIPSDCIEVQCPEGFQKPKWDGAKWDEGLTQAEIDELNNPKTKEPTSIERLEALELALLDML